MCKDKIKRIMTSWWMVFVFCLSSAVGAVLWADDQHDALVINCQSMIDREAIDTSQRYADGSRVDVLEVLLDRIDKKLDRLEGKIDRLNLP